ncbi:MAG TPA: transferrin receptor-like dimerization domain-containing protein [Vicinamibacteria bacterium]|nr:transferrin receptor-like dimerization domain-containing protein [Vicinamibacteria bacterium]
MGVTRTATACLATIVLAAGVRGGDETPLGFSTDGFAAQRQLEARFDAQLDPRNLRTWMERLAAHPHHVGSPWGRENAEFMAGLFRSWGYETRIETFDVLLPTPLERRLEMLGPRRFVASLEEPALSADRTSGQKKEQLPTYNAYSVDGDVTGELVYVNYGVPADYEELALRGVDVKGRIVIARYGGSWRGIKPKVAAEHGAVGCIIYSDPVEDGFVRGDAYPKGGWRPDTGVQRGSVKDMPIHSGDPLTPGWAATKEARRLALAEATTLTKIPVLPISAADARPLLEAIGGPLAPAAWRGALPISYRLGPGPARVRLAARFDWRLVPAHDVIATLPGSERPDEWVLRGNHHDAWVNGASDPVSGMVALLEEARAVGELAKSGFRPRRTLVYAAWDGEEQGLLGSSEWVEAHLDELQAKAVAYVNTDSNARGFLQAGGSHSLETFVNQALADVQDPLKGIGVLKRARARAVLEGAADERRAARAKKGMALDALGSGSDYTPFLQHAGVASLNVGYGDEDEYGQYHSIYDSLDHYTRFMDPDFAYGVALARSAGRIVLRLAQAETLPLDFGPVADNLARYVREVEELATRMHEETEDRNRDLDEGLFAAWFTPHETRVAPPRREPVPHLNFAPLRNAMERVQKARTAFDRAREARAGRSLTPERARELDGVLRGCEQSLLRAEGLPGRPWYRHQVYAPGRYTGYGVKTLPAVREALELRSWREAEEQIGVVARTLEGFAAEVERAARLLGES